MFARILILCRYTMSLHNYYWANANVSSYTNLCVNYNISIVSTLVCKLQIIGSPHQKPTVALEAQQWSVLE